jgi:hypothetical protein
VAPPSSDWPELDQATLTIAPGCSGGGVFNSRGEQIGIVLGGMDAHGVTLYVPERILEVEVNKIKSGWVLNPARATPSDLELQALIAADEAEQKANDFVKNLLKELTK